MITLAKNQSRHLGRIIHLPEVPKWAEGINKAFAAGTDYIPDDCKGVGVMCDYEGTPFSPKVYVIPENGKWTTVNDVKKLELIEKAKKELLEILGSPKFARRQIMYVERADGTLRRVTPYWFTHLFRKYVINKWKYFLVNIEWDYKTFVSEIKERYLSNGIKGVLNL